ncbi:MAG: hypothetical protein FWG09_06330 [Synergistaceae bacterium]|nr:hypothetical protein [Synergistaceae bacterium]
MKKIFIIALLLSFAFTAPAMAATETAEYQILTTTMGGMQGMQMPLTMELDARGTPVTGGAQEATHFIPAGMKMGNELPLLRPEQQGGGKDAGGVPGVQENWTVKIYWGSSKTVQKGQPIVISPQDMKSGKGKFAELANVGTGVRRSAPPSGWGWGKWPNKKSSIQVPKGASLKGSHRLEGNYLPQIKFDVSNHDFLPPLNVKMGGDLKSSIPLSWGSVKGAVGYFAYAMASNQAKKETIIWTSSSKPTMGIMMHEHSSKIKELVKSGIVMGPDKSACDIPAGIFAECDGAMVMASAWGEDYWVSHPPKPNNAPKNWKPDWTVNALFMSQWSGVPGMPDMPDMESIMREYGNQEENEKENEKGSSGGKKKSPGIGIPGIPGIKF